MSTADVPVPSTKKSNASKNNMGDALGRRHEYQLAVEFILELLTENTINKCVAEVWQGMAGVLALFYTGNCEELRCSCQIFGP
jgi:hypothetical protein